MTTRTLNLTDDYRRLHLQHREDDPTFLYVLLFVPDRIADRKVAYARVDLQQCRFRTSSGGPVFWAGQTNFSISEQESCQIEEFLAQCREYWEAVK